MIDSRECSSPEPDPRVLALLTLSTLTWQRRVQEGQTLGARRLKLAFALCSYGGALFHPCLSAS